QLCGARAPRRPPPGAGPRRAPPRGAPPGGRGGAPPVSAAPAEPFAAAAGAEAVLDPFSVYQKGEALLRRQLSALAGWHLVNIIRKYELSREDPELLTTRAPAQLVETIVSGVRSQSA